MFGTGYFSTRYATIETPIKARSLPRLPIDRFRPEADLIDSDVEFLTKDECKSFYVDTKRNAASKSTPIVDYADLQAETEAIRLLGEPNEVEYSANINILDLRLASDPLMYRNRRFYYSSETELTANEERVSTRYFDTATSNVLRSLNIVLRVDYVDDDDDDNRTVEEASAKLKLTKRSFLQGGCKFTLTGSIEIPYDVESFRFDDPTTAATTNRQTKIRYVRYWHLAVTHDGQTYAFKVAVRTRQTVDRRRTCPTDQMNIECENRNIDGQLFVVVFHALYAYYRTQYFDHERTIRPIRKDMALDKIEDITAAQRRMLRTMRLVDKKEAERLTTTPTTTTTPEQQIASLVRYLGLQSYAHFFPYGVKYNGTRDPFTGVCVERVATCPSDALEHANDDDMFL